MTKAQLGTVDHDPQHFVEEKCGLISAGHERAVLLILVFGSSVWSLVGAHDLRMWALEVLPFVPCWIVVIGSLRRFPLSRLAFRLLSIFVLLHLVGAHYMYSEVPFGSWVQEILELERNPFDRWAHLSFGVMGAIVARELMLRTSPLRPGPWLSFLSFSCVMCGSAIYEILEWRAWVFIGLERPGTDLLGAQGDIWDSQWDMALAALAAILGLLFLRGIHDASIAEIETENSVVSHGLRTTQ